MPTATQARTILAATAVALCLAYLGGGARGIGVTDRDRVFSPADAAALQLELPARDVPVANAPTVSNLIGRASLAIALGRRTALRDLAAVATALAIAVIGAWWLALGVDASIACLTMLCMAVGATFWGRGIAWTHDALAPLLMALAVLAGTQWFRRRRRRDAAVALALAVAAMIDGRPDVLHLSPGGSVRALTSEFTLLGVVLIAAGLAALSRRGAMSGRFVLSALAGAAAWELAGFRSTFDPVTVPLALAGWTAVALGLQWIRGAVAPRAARGFVAAIALVLIAQPALTRIRLWDLGRDQPSDTRIRAAAAIRIADLPDNAAFVAEAHQADVMLRLAIAAAGRDVPVVPQGDRAVAAAVDSGATVLAFDNARAHLEQRGFLFERSAVGDRDIAAVAGRMPCVALDADSWQDVSLLVAGGSLFVHGSSPGQAPAGVVIRTAAAAPLVVSGIEPRGQAFEITGVPRDAEGVPELLQVARRGGTPASLASIRMPHEGRREPVRLTFAAAPAYAVATAEDGGTALLCPGVLPTDGALRRTPNAAVSVPMNDNAPFGAGWHPSEADPDFFRWTGAPDAAVRVTILRPGPIRVTITATPASRPAQRPAIGLTVNQCRLATHPMPAGQGDYAWEVAERCWRTGVNELWIHTTPLISPASLFATHDTRLLGARIGAIRLARE